MAILKHVRVRSAPIQLPEEMVTKGATNLQQAYTDKEVVNRFNAAVGTLDSATARQAVPSAENFDNTLDPAKIFAGGVSGAVLNLRQQMNVKAQVGQMIAEVNAFHDDPARQSAAIAKWMRRFRNGALRGLRYSGGPFGLPKISSLGARMLAGDAKGLASAPASLAQVIANAVPTESCFRDAERRTAVSAVTGAVQQALSFLHLALLEAAYDAAAITAAVAEFDARTTSIGQSFMKPGEFFVIEYITAPIGYDMICQDHQP